MCVQDIDVQCVLQFTLIHAAGCALHRRTSRVIHRPKLYLDFFIRRSWPINSVKNAQCVQNENKREDKGRPTANWSDSLNLAACSEAGAPASTRL